MTSENTYIGPSSSEPLIILFFNLAEDLTDLVFERVRATRLLLEPAEIRNVWGVVLEGTGIPEKFENRLLGPTILLRLLAIPKV